MRFAIRHAVATSITVGAIVGVTAASYFALLLWAILVGGGLGGPLTFPFMVLLALVASVAMVLLVLLPSTAITEWLRDKWKFPIVAEIPVATLMMVACVAGLTALTTTLRGSSLTNALEPAAIVAAVLLVPLGAYWWSLRSTEWVIGVAKRYSERLRIRPFSDRTFESDV